MSTEKLTRPCLRVCASVLAAGGLTLSALGLALGTAQAAPSAPTYHHHWCPGDYWDQGGWGNNWDWRNCHDWDDNFGPAGWVAPPPWAVQPPPPWWAPWAP